MTLNEKNLASQKKFLSSLPYQAKISRITLNAKTPGIRFS